MGLSRLSKTCQTCLYVETCNHKRMETLEDSPAPTPNLDILNSQTIEIKVDDILLSKLTDSLKPVLSAIAYVEGEKEK